ncbi:type III-B CRISPR-associated protein Cas10/Cmr2 [Sulfurimonas sp. NWX367]|uniref:Cas10/Cmr2 second palm domain-containing protein n=1 Tax=Sulfurimonas sp. NWX367 TaxID=2925413 RepID=UPI003204E561
MKYIGLTIGPIYKTLKKAKKPKELFSSSYIFSYIMKEIVQKFKTRKFITPYVNDDVFKIDKVGLFHDRLIFKSQKGDAEALERCIDEVLNDVAQKLAVSFENVKNYLQIHFIEKELSADANPIIKLTPYLDTKELMFEVTQDESFANALRRKKGDKDNFLTEGKNIVDDIKKLCYHNYYCIVHADGDKMGVAIEKPENISKVSQALFHYCQNAHESVKKFGGQTIFAGGDDLLFFAPVIGKDKSTIFNLCDKIAQDFSTNIPEATLSFGISINYVKFPLYEALENSRKQLFAKAKTEDKNSVAFQVTKHSGQSFETIIRKNDTEVYQKFLKLMTTLEDEQNNSNFLHSLHHKIKSYKTTLNEILHNEKKLHNFFDNYFNEAGHSEYKDFFDELVSYMAASKDLNQVYATLRFMKFVKGDK